MKKIRVLVVEDTALMRRVISDIIAEHEEIELVATARDGIDGLEKIKKYKPDVVTLDIDMPRLNGMETLRHIMSKDPVPVIMISSHTRAGSESTLKALELGAVDFIAKASKISSREAIDELSEILPQKIIAAAGASLNLIPIEKPEPLETDVKTDLLQHRAEKPRVIVAIGASTGGPNVLEAVFSAFPADLPAAVILSQHMPSGFTLSFSQRLDRLSPLLVKEAAEGDPLLKGRALVAPGGYHMIIRKGTVHLDQGPKVNYVRPSIDVMFESLVTCSQKVLAVIMTGMGKDGAMGAVTLKKYKEDSVFGAQDPASALIPGMPEALIQNVDCDFLAKPARMAAEITRKVKSML